MNGTLFYGIQLKNKNAMGGITKHLALNGYTFDTNGDDTLFVYSEEIDYVVTILKDWEVEYEII